MSRDLEAGEYGGGDSASETDSDSDDPFDVRTTTNSYMDRLQRWRQAALVLNKSRRFRYTLDLKKEEEKQQLLKKIRSHAQDLSHALVVRAGSTFPNASRERIKRLVRDRDLGALEQHDGVRGLSLLLNTDLENGIPEDSGEILRRREVYGSNTIHWKKQKSLWRFLLESSQDVTWSLLMLAAIASLFLGIKTKTINHGWLNEASIAFTIVIVVIITAISNYKQSLQFEKSSKEKTNVCLEVIRGGRRVRIAIYDIVVGDILPLRNGDLVPADGVLSSAYSLQIDESRITGESKIVQKDLHMDPFLISGSKVKDGIGTMLVTSVGMNTPWGVLMTSNSQETVEKTPLQVFLNGIATATGLISVSLAIVVLLFQSWRYFMGQTKSTNGTPMFLHGKTTAGEATDYVIGTIILGITIVAISVPIGLPLAVKLK